MGTTPSPTPPAPAGPSSPSSLVSEIEAFQKLISGGLKLDFNATFPFESTITAILNFATAHRTTMDPDLRKRFDAIFIQQLEDTQYVWRGMLVALKILPAEAMARSIVVPKK